MSQMPPDRDPYSPSHQSAPGITIAALVCGIIGLCFTPLALVALILGIIGLSRTGTPGADKGRGYAVTGTILGGTGLVIFPIIMLLIAILLPALGAARRTARRMQNSTQLREIHQGLVMHANTNKNYYPGLDSKGRIIGDGLLTGHSGDGNTPQARFWILLDASFITPDYAVSPSETEAIYAYSGTGPVTADHYSYALLSFQAGNDRTGTGDQTTFGVDPADANRANEWKQTLNPQAIVTSDRNTGSNTSTAIQSIHTDSPGGWKGSVLWNDNHVNFEQTPVFSTQYGSAATNQQDHLFEDETNGSDALMVHE